MTYRGNDSKAGAVVFVIIVIAALLTIASFVIASAIKEERDSAVCEVFGGVLYDGRCFDPADEIDLDKVVGK